MKRDHAQMIGKQIDRHWTEDMFYLGTRAVIMSRAAFDEHLALLEESADNALILEEALKDA